MFLLRLGIPRSVGNVEAAAAINGREKGKEDRRPPAGSLTLWQMSVNETHMRANMFLVGLR